MEHVLLVGDSLTFHGPRQPELLTHPGLYPNVLARALGMKVDVVARLGFTARDAWWALTRDPVVYSTLLPRARAVVLAVGNTDQLPASLPTWLREGIAYLRPDRLRGAVRSGYHRAHPYLVRATGGRLRVLGQPATDRYLTRCADGIRHFHPGIPLVGVVPPPYDAAYHGHVDRPHRAAAAAARSWGLRTQVPMLDLDRIVAPHLGRLNPDGMHWSWPVHEQVGTELAMLLRNLLAGSDSLEAGLERGEPVREPGTLDPAFLHRTAQPEQTALGRLQPGRGERREGTR